jgi:hypothetical protein
LNDAQLAELAFQVLLPHIKEKYTSQKFESLTQLLHRMSNQDVCPYAPYGKEEDPKFGFDVTKADKIFDLLLQEGQIKLSQYHTIPSADELKKIRYCKWHDATFHSTNDCKIFRQQIQIAIEQGRLKFEIPKKPSKPMKIDQHPFPTNVCQTRGHRTLYIT